MNTPFRIFLSYGHDAHEELVRRIHADLKERGHDVWFDKSDIKAGDDCRRSITEGNLKSRRVLFFLSKHSVAAQFCEWDKPDHLNAPRDARSLAFQLANDNLGKHLASITGQRVALSPQNNVAHR